MLLEKGRRAANPAETRSSAFHAKSVMNEQEMGFRFDVRVRKWKRGGDAGPRINWVKGIAV